MGPGSTAIYALRPCWEAACMCARTKLEGACVRVHMKGKKCLLKRGLLSLQGYLHGASFDTNGGMSPLEGSSPGAHPSIAPMSWAQSFEGSRLMHRHLQPLVVHTAD